jgi:hypothetical protein
MKITEQRLKELVNKLEVATTDGDVSTLTQDDIGDLYDIMFERLNDEIKTHSTTPGQS